MRSYPTLILLQDGKVKAQYTGKRDLTDLIQFVTSTLNEQPQVKYIFIVAMDTSYFL